MPTKQNINSNLFDIKVKDSKKRRRPGTGLMDSGDNSSELQQPFEGSYQHAFKMRQLHPITDRENGMNNWPNPFGGSFGGGLN
jgi:hypothetical protein